MPLKMSRSVHEALRDHRTVVVADVDGREHFVDVTLKAPPKLARNASLAALEQVGGSEYDFHIELPRREVWGAEVILDD